MMFARSISGGSAKSRAGLLCWAARRSLSKSSIVIPRPKARRPESKGGTGVGSAPNAKGSKESVPIEDALEAVLTHAKVVKRRKFVETVDMALQLGVDPRKPNQSVRGVQTLPHGTGKKVRIAVFARGQDAEAAKAAGASLVGADELVASIQQGNLDFDRCVATPDVMPLVSRVARILGPRGLMPNPKMGTVTKDVAAAVKSAMAGQVQFKADRFGMVHLPVGKTNFPFEALTENIRTAMVALSNAKPEGAKGKYFKSVHINSTMGIAVPVDVSTIDPRSSRFMLKSEKVAAAHAEAAKRQEEAARRKAERLASDSAVSDSATTDSAGSDSDTLSDNDVHPVSVGEQAETSTDPAKPQSQ